MSRVKGVKFNWLILGLFFIGLMITAIALFGITYLGSLSVAELEVERRAERQHSLSSFVFETHLKQMEGQLRAAAIDQDLVKAIKDYDSGRATSVLELLGENSAGAQPDVLILDHERQMGWLNASLALVDVGAVIPGRDLRTMPPDVWRVYANQDADPAAIVAVIAIPVVDPENGRMIARLIGGSSINDSFALLDNLASILAVDNLAIVYDGQNLGSFGELSNAEYFQHVLNELGPQDYTLRDSNLYTSSLLYGTNEGVSLYAVTSEPSDTLENIQTTYLEIFFPFLLYVAIASLAAALVVNRFTGPSLRRLVEHASDKRQTKSLVPHEPGRIAEYNLLGSLFDEAFHSVQQTNAQFREMIDGSLQGIIVHADKKILYVNDAMRKILEYPPEEQNTLVDKEIFSIYAPSEHERLQKYHELRKAGEVVPAVYEIEAIQKSGNLVWLEQHVRMTTWNGQNAFYITVLDISDRKEQEKLIEQHTNFDALTNLPNRTLFRDRLQQNLGQLEVSSGMGALLIIDLDRFKALNDIYSHEFGDRILITIAERIEKTLGPGDTASRLGGDEFAVILSDLEDEWEIERRAQEILNTVCRKINVDKDNDAVLTASIGISVYPFDGKTEEALMQQADAAMYQAKNDGGNRFRFFSKQLNERATRAHLLETALRKAIENDQLHIHIQPIIECVTGTVSGCEALVRWDDDELGSISPGEFIPVAEDSGLIVPLGEIVLKKACEFHQECIRRGFDLNGIGVNISPRQCREDGFVGKIKSTLEETGMPARNLHLEITENVMFDDSRIDPVSLLKAIKSLGVKISLDDFGIGYSSLSYLKRLPIDTLKIDRSFIKDLENDPDDQALVNAIVTMANALSVGVVCEGVETIEQNDILKRMGCRHIQGFYYGKPMPEAEFLEFLAEEPFKTETERKVS